MEKKKMLTLIASAVIPGGLAGLAIYLLAVRCWHQYSWPRKDKKTKKHYVVCIKCSGKFEYDWNKMKVGKEFKDAGDSDSSASRRTVGLGRAMAETQE